MLKQLLHVTEQKETATVCLVCPITLTAVSQPVFFVKEFPKDALVWFCCVPRAAHEVYEGTKLHEKF